MQKRLRKAICAVLAVLLLTAVLPMGVFAANEELIPEDFSSVEQGILSETPCSGGYTSLGDSIAAAYATEEYERKAGGPNIVDDTVIVPGSYADMVQQYLHVDGITRAHSAWRTTDFLYLVGDQSIESRLGSIKGFLTDGKLDVSKVVADSSTFIDWYLFSSLNQKTIEKGAVAAFGTERKQLPEDLAASDVITINMGANDIFTAAMLHTFLDADSPVSKMNLGITDLEADLSLADLVSLFAKMLADTKDLIGMVGYLFAQCQKGVESFEANFPKVLDYVREQSPNAQIYVLSLDNPLQINLTIDGEAINLLQLAAPYVLETNLFTMSLCDCYDNVTFTDVQGTEYFGIEDFDLSRVGDGLVSTLMEFIRVVHPTEAGQRHMGECIISVMERELETPVAKVSLDKLGQPEISWDKTKDAVSYRVYRSTDEKSGYKLLAATPLNKWVDLTASAGKTYYYRVIAATNLSGTSRSAASTAVSIAVPSLNLNTVVVSSVSLIAKGLKSLLKKK